MLKINRTSHEKSMTKKEKEKSVTEVTYKEDKK